MTQYDVYKVEDKTSAKGNAYKKLVLQEKDSQYPIKNVTMFASHPLFEEIGAGQTVELDIETKDSDTPNPHGGFYKNRTVLNPGQSRLDTPKQATAPTQSKDISNAEVKNAITLGVMPALDKMYKEILAISGRQERQMGLDPKAIDDAFDGGLDSPKDDINPDDVPF